MSFKVAGSGAVVGGLQVAVVKKSTRRRIKKRGKVPPRLQTLVLLVCGDQTEGNRKWKKKLT